MILQDTSKVDLPSENDVKGKLVHSQLTGLKVAFKGEK